MNPRWTLMMLVAALVSICAYGCTPLAEKYPALTRAQLQHDVRLGRERENRFNTVYKDPEKYSRKERNLAVWNLPPLPVPKECKAPHTAGKFDCMHALRRPPPRPAVFHYFGENWGIRRECGSLPRRILSPSPAARDPSPALAATTRRHGCYALRGCLQARPQSGLRTAIFQGARSEADYPRRLKIPNLARPSQAVCGGAKTQIALAPPRPLADQASSDHTPGIGYSSL
jgi:hypothetical protein